MASSGGDSGAFSTEQIKWTAAGRKQREAIDFLLPMCYRARNSKWSCPSPRLSRDSALIFAVLQMSESGQTSVSHPSEAQPRCRKPSNGGARANMKAGSLMYELRKQPPSAPLETAVRTEI